MSALSTWWNKWKSIVGACALAVCVGFFLAAVGLHVFNRQTAGYIEREAQACIAHASESEQIECWYSLMRHEFDRGGITRALNAFTYLYNTYPAFAQSGCHRHAHAVGDMAYYVDYLNHRDLSRMEFPPAANACGYGFYHGFFEHLVQEHPDPAFVTQTCEYFTDRLKDTAPAIQQICYHGSGHGFLLARADTLLDPEQWTIAAFTSDALAQCEALPHARAYDISECRQGIYNVLVDWMSDGAYNLSHDSTHPFAMCDAEVGDRQSDCYYEVAQKLDSFSNRDAVVAGRIVAELPREDIRPLVLTTGIAGMVQHDPGGTQKDLLLGCREVGQSLRDACLTGIVGGLVEHAAPGDVHKGAVRFCEDPELTEDERIRCHNTLRIQLARYYTDDTVASLCTDGQLPATLCASIEL